MTMFTLRATPVHPPERPPKLASSISSAQSKKLFALDGGICLITGDKAPLNAIEDAHIVQRRLPVDTVCSHLLLNCRLLIPTQIKFYERLWGLPLRGFNVDSRFNRVHRELCNPHFLPFSDLYQVRCDLHRAFDTHLWALIPAKAVLDQIYDDCSALLKTGLRHSIYTVCCSLFSPLMPFGLKFRAALPQRYGSPIRICVCSPQNIEDGTQNNPHRARRYLGTL